MLNNKKVLFFFFSFPLSHVTFFHRLSAAVLPGLMIQLTASSCLITMVSPWPPGGPWWPLVAPELPAAAEGPCGTRLRGSGAPGCPGGGVMMGGDTEGRTWAH